ncbi:HAMP domain-containing sensor histidine kinase [Pelagicoccus sp. SDUM812003]|nr:HAMP domain-containing sensor histidine kinase [Pelagicoccus sp. SDUM812003]
MSPVLCVVWLVSNAVENENESLARLVAETNQRRLADAEGLILTWLESGELDLGEGSVAYPLDVSTPSVTRQESDRARQVLQEARDGKALDWFASVLEDDAKTGLRLLGGRFIGPILLAMAVEQIDDGAVLSPRFQSAADAYVLRFLQSQADPVQKRFLMRTYAPHSDSEAILAFAEKERMVEAWLNEVGGRERLLEFDGMARSENFLYLRKEGEPLVRVFRLDALFDKLESQPDLKELGVGVSLAGTPRTAETESRVLAAPLSFLELRLRDGVSLEELSSDRLMLYLWVVVIVLVLSLVSGGTIVVMLKRQASVNQLKDDLVATVTHELKTPVSSIRLLIDTLLDEDRIGKVDAREYIELVSRENQRLGRLIDNFLSFSRMERSKGNFEIRPVSPAETVRVAVEAFRERFQGQGFELACEVDEEVPEIAADQDALVTVLGNLMENAFKYGGPNPRIELRLRKGQKAASFEVRDFGVGISKRDQKLIFRKFYQTANSRGRHSGSVGLGLSIVHFVVSKHMGHVEVESELGKGSLFRVSIPYA